MMAVSKATIKTALKDLYASAKASELTDDQFADGMADIIRNAVLSITVTVSGVQTGGSTITGTNT
jgi:hypothetical protein